LKFDIGNLKFN